MKVIREYPLQTDIEFDKDLNDYVVILKSKQEFILPNISDLLGIEFIEGEYRLLASVNPDVPTTKVILDVFKTNETYSETTDGANGVAATKILRAYLGSVNLNERYYHIYEVYTT